MKSYMLHTASLTVTAADRAVADQRRREVISAGRLNPSAGPIEGVSPQVGNRDRITCRYGSMAVMHISGAIASSEDDVVCWLMGGIPSTWIEEDARALATDSTIETVVLSLATPGGAVAGFSGVSEALKALGRAKRLVAVVADSAYSLGAVIAAHAKEVYITPTGGMGNIGIISGPFVDETKALEKAGVEVYYPCSPDGKAWGRPGSPVPDELKASLGRATRVWYEELVSVFAERGLSTSDIDGMNAAIFAAPDAVALGLADGVQTYEAVLSALFAGNPVPSMPQSDDVGPTDDTEEPELVTTPSGLSPAALSRTESHMDLTAPQWAALTAEAVTKKRPDLVEKLAPTPAATAPAPATIDELKAAFPGESDFIVDAASGKLTLDAANAKFVAVLRARLEASAKELTETKAALAAKPAVDPVVEKAKATVAKVVTVEAGSVPGSQPAATCPHKTSAEAIQAIAAEKRIPVAQAANEARKAWPELFKARTA